MNAEILSIGTEILLGDILNSDAQFLSQELAALGVNVHYQSVVGDNPERLRQALNLALSRNDLVVTSGGLGPTDDDLTKQTICAALGVELRRDERAYEQIARYFRQSGRAMTPNNEKQAMIPEGCVPFYNDYGTAPGCAIEKDGKIVMMFPGPPREIIPMFQKDGRAFLEKYSDSVIVSTSVRVFGRGESEIEGPLQELLDGANPTTALYAKDGEVLIRVTSKEKTQQEANKKCRETVNRIVDILGEFVYGENVDNLQQVVVQLLRDKKMKLATAESCTGGLISQKITSIPGSSEVFEYGICCYANRVKAETLSVQQQVLDNYGAVSVQTAKAMAEGMARISGADLAIGVTGIAGPGGGTPEKPVGLVYISLCDKKDCWVKELRMARNNKERAYIREYASMHALDLVRRYLLGLPLSAQRVTQEG